MDIPGAPFNQKAVDVNSWQSGYYITVPRRPKRRRVEINTHNGKAPYFG